MPEPNLYCPKCEHQLWMTQDGKFYFCPGGHINNMPKKVARQRYYATSSSQEAAAKSAKLLRTWKHTLTMEEKAERNKLVEYIRTLPICAVEHVSVHMAHKPLWWVEGKDGLFIRTGWGLLPGDGNVHAIQPKHKGERAFFVTLIQATKAEIHRIVFGKPPEDQCNEK